MVSGGRELTRGQNHFLRAAKGRSRRSFQNGLTPCPVNRCLITSFDPNTAVESRVTLEQPPIARTLYNTRILSSNFSLYSLSAFVERMAAIEQDHPRWFIDITSFHRRLIGVTQDGCFGILGEFCSYGALRDYRLRVVRADLWHHWLKTRAIFEEKNQLGS